MLSRSPDDSLAVRSESDTGQPHGRSGVRSWTNTAALAPAGAEVPHNAGSTPKPSLSAARLGGVLRDVGVRNAGETPSSSIPI